MPPLKNHCKALNIICPTSLPLPPPPRRRGSFFAYISIAQVSCSAAVKAPKPNTTTRAWHSLGTSCKSRAAACLHAPRQHNDSSLLYFPFLSNNTSTTSKPGPGKGGKDFFAHAVYTKDVFLGPSCPARASRKNSGQSSTPRLVWWVHAHATPKRATATGQTTQKV